MKKVCTLCIAYNHPNVLLGMKKRGFGVGRWNGFGGKVKDGETIEIAAKREMEEEAGITIKEMEKVGILDFKFQNNPENIEVHLFRIDAFDGEPEEGEEMKPQWFNINDIPFHAMWPDDKHWFPLFLEGSKFHARFLFDSSDNIIEKELAKVDPEVEF